MFKLCLQPGSPGLRCDEDGLFLGGEALVDRDVEGNFLPRPSADLRKHFSRIYGNEGNWESRIRSVALVASALNNGDMSRATMTAVLMRLPDPDGSTRITDVDGVLAKAGFNPDEPRDERGRWTTGSGVTGVQLADAGVSDASDDPVTQATRRAAEAARQDHRGIGSIDRLLEEYTDHPNVVVAAADDVERDPRFGIGGELSPRELIPERLQHSPAGPAVEFLDNLLDITGPGDEANLEATQILQHNLLQAIHRIDPSYVYQSLEPQGGLAAMSWQERRNVIAGLRADLAATIFRVRGDMKPLQEVTLDYMQRETNAAYDEAIELYKAGKLKVRLSPQEAIGNHLDGVVRMRLRDFFNGLRISTDSGSPIRVNSRAYNSSSAPAAYRLPDVRIGNFAFDTSLREKSASDAQIKDFFRTDFAPAGVVIVRPNQLGRNSSYVIWRTDGD